MMTPEEDRKLKAPKQLQILSNKSRLNRPVAKSFIEDGPGNKQRESLSHPQVYSQIPLHSE